jgi:hypothetical protein
MTSTSLLPGVAADPLLPPRSLSESARTVVGPLTMAVAGVTSAERPSRPIGALIARGRKLLPPKTLVTRIDGPPADPRLTGKGGLAVVG